MLAAPVCAATAPLGVAPHRLPRARCGGPGPAPGWAGTGAGRYWRRAGAGGASTWAGPGLAPANSGADRWVRPAGGGNATGRSQRTAGRCAPSRLRRTMGWWSAWEGGWKR